MKTGFHFSNRTLSNDLSHVKVVAGLEVSFNGTPLLCQQGLHSSPSILEALKYAPGFFLSTTETNGNIVEGKDKFVGQKRKHVQVIDSKKWILLFAYWCARRAKKHATYAADTAADITAATYAAATYAATTYAVASAAADAATYAAASAADAYAADASAAAAYANAYSVERKLQHKVLNAYMHKAGLKF